MLDSRILNDFEYIKINTGSEDANKLVYTLCKKEDAVIEFTSNCEILVFEYVDDVICFLRNFKNSQDYSIVPTTMGTLYNVIYDGPYKLLYKRRKRPPSIFSQLKKVVSSLF
jgi:hypothetical protein